MAPTSNFPLYNRLLNGRLLRLLTEWRAEGVSYEGIAVRLRMEGISITGETVRRWCINNNIPSKSRPAA